MADVENQDYVERKHIVIELVPNWDYIAGNTHLRVIALSTLKAYWDKYPEHLDSRAPMLAWYRHALAADWDSPQAVKKDFGSASILHDGRVVFNISGNKYRLVVWINYAYRVVYIRFIGTHKQYDQINAQNI